MRQAGLFDVLAFAMRKHEDDPLVLAPAAGAMFSLTTKEKPATVQKLARDAIPAVVGCVRMLHERLLCPLVHALTKDSSDNTGFAMRVGCRREWLAEDSNVVFGEDGKVVMDAPKGKGRAATKKK